MLSFLTFLMFFAIFYTYFLYPLMLILLPKRVPAHNTEAPPRQVSIIVAARNEENFIGERLENVLSIENPSNAKIEVIVCSDASDDGTDEIVRSFASRGVRLVRSEERKGKEHAQKLAIGESSGEVLIFTDSKVKTESTLVTNTLRYFTDPTIGAVSSIDRVEVGVEGGSGEGMYVRYEMFLRNLESQFSSLVGLSGSCFAVRREVAQNLRTDIPSDFALLLATIQSGRKGVLAPDVVCSYKAVKTEEQEFARKVRTVVRGIATLFSVPEVMQFNAVGPFAWQVISHKLLRWLVPWFLIIGTLGAFPLSERSSFWYLVSLALTAFYALALVGYLCPEHREKKLVKLPLFFIVTNYAVLVAWIRYIRGERAVSWNPSAR
jgi:cellulose synthase/poly-beta-1,6-N-acetylglucosamine synthase-like glycosyltransferase